MQQWEYSVIARFKTTIPTETWKNVEDKISARELLDVDEGTAGQVTITICTIQYLAASGETVEHVKSLRQGIAKLGTEGWEMIFHVKEDDQNDSYYFKRLKK
jgi:hypothetical protein